MPLLSWNDANSVQDLLPGRLPEQPEPAAPQEAPGFVDVMAAAFRKGHIVTNLYDRSYEAMTTDQPGYDFSTDVTGYEDHAMRFVRSHSPEETQQIKWRIDRENNANATLQQAGGWGLAASLAEGIVDPFTIASMALPLAAPVGWGGRAARVGAGIAANAAVDVGAEVAMHKLQETRTLGESAFRVSAGVLLNGAFGAWATRVPKSEFEAMREGLAKELNTPMAEGAQSMGAMRVGDNTTLEDESIATVAGRVIAGTVGRISPLAWIFTKSSVKEARILAQELGDVPFMLNKNLKGMGTADSVETRIVQRDLQSKIQTIRNFEGFYQIYKQRVGKEAMSLREFGVETSKALRRGDVHDIPEVQKVAAQTRKQFDADKAALQELGVLPEDFDLLGAKSYFPRVYDHNAIANNESSFRAALKKWYTENPYGQRELAKAKGETKAALDAHAPVAAEVDAAKAARLELQKTISANRTARKVAARQLTRAERHADAIDMRLQELEAQHQDLTDQLRNVPKNAEQSVKEALALDIRRTMNQMERLRERGVRLDDIRAQREQQALEVEHEFEKLRAAGKEAKQALNEAKAAAEKTQAKLSQARDAERDATKKATPRDDAEITSAVADTMDKIMGTVRGGVDLGHAASPRPLKARTLDVPDEILEPYLVSNFEHVMGSYHRGMASQIEMRKAFDGSTELTAEKEAIVQAYQAKAARITNDKTLKALREEEAGTLLRLEGMRQRLLNQVGPKGNESQGLVRAARLIRSYNYVTKLGGQTLSSLSDYGHVITRYGLAKTAMRTARFLTDLNANRLIREDAKRMGTALDWWLDSRSRTLADIGDESMGGSAVERGMDWASGKFTHITGMSTWNSSIKAITSSLEQDAILRAVQQGDKLSAFTRGKLAQAGIGDEELKVIGEQLALHGENEGLVRARTDLWDKSKPAVREAAQRVEDAVVKAGNLMSIRAGVGDLPLLMNKDMARTLFQFKSFGMASVNRILIPVAQGLSRGDAATANGFAAMLTLGAMTYITKEWAAGREPDLTPGRVTAEALNWSGVLGYLPDVWDPITGLMPNANIPGTETSLRDLRFSRFKDQSPIMTLLGPTVGTLADTYGTISGVTKDGLSQKDIHNLRRSFVPLQNLFYIRRIVNAVEGEVGEATGADGATNEDFTDRVIKTEKPKK